MKSLWGSLGAVSCLAVLLTGCGGASANSGTITNPQVTTPTVSTVAPATIGAGAAATTITVTGTGFSSTTAIQVNGVAEATTYVSATQVTAVVPAGQLATGALLSVVAANGSATSTAVNLEVDNPAPAITQFAPGSVIAGSGAATIAVSGTGFVPGTTIQLNGTARPTTVVSGTQANVALSAADTAIGGALSLTVVNAAPGGGSSAATTLPVNNPVPVLTQLAPAALIAGSASTSLTVSGSGFLAGTIVRVNGAARATTYVSATQLTAVLTAADLASAASLAVTAFTPAPGGGVSGAISLAVNNPGPAISQLAPASLAAGSPATTVALTGSGFVSTSVVQVNGSARGTAFVSATQLSVSLTAADLATGATLSLTAVNPAPGGGSSAAASLTVVNPVPAITLLAPASLVTGSAGASVTVTGTGFVPGTVIQISGIGRATAYVSATQVNTTLTAADLATSGSVSLVASNPAPGGGTSSAASIAVNYVSPKVTSFSPAALVTGTLTPTTVVVNGTSFVPATVVFLGGLSILNGGTARATTYISPTQISFVATVADQATAGNLAVYPETPGGGGAYYYGIGTLPVVGPTAQPVISSVQPASLIAGSSTTYIVVTAYPISSTSTVLWNGAALATDYDSGRIGYYPATLTATVPASLIATAGTASITVNNPTSSPTLSSATTVNINNPPAPTLTTIAPAYGPLNTDATLTVTGIGFAAGSMVNFNGVSVPTTFANSTTLTANVPASAVNHLGNLNVTVTTPAPGGGTSAALMYSTYVGIANNSMIYNAANGLFYLSVPSSAGAPYGNSIVSLDPLTGALGTPIFVGSEPNKLAITSDGKYLWVGLDGASAVRKVDLTTNTAGLQFSLPAQTGFLSAASTAYALAALPGAPDSVVVSSSPSSSSTVVIYDSGVARQGTVSTTAYNIYALAVNGTLGEVYAGAGGTYSVFTYNASGLTAKTTASNGSYAALSFDEMQIANGILYTDYGNAYDPETGNLLGTFYSSSTTAASGTTTVDATLGKVFTLDSSSTSNNTYNQIQIFNTADYNQTSASVIPVNVPSLYGNSVSIYPSRLTRWGTNGLAFRVSYGVYSLRSNLVKDLSSTSADLKVTLATSGSTATGGNTIYTATVSNAGPSAATNVALTATTPSTGVLVSATPSVGTCSVVAPVTCDLGGLAVNASATVNFVVTQTAPGSATLTAQVSGSETDPGPTDNQASITATITGSAYSLVPVIQSVAPASVLSGSSDTLITVTGTNFSNASAITVGGTALATNFISGTQLTATVPASQLSTLGWLPIAVTSPAPGGGSSARLPLSIYSIVNLVANRMLFDPYTRNIMATVSPNAMNHTGNAVVAITPETATVGTPVPIGSEPYYLALTGDGQILYVSLLGSNSVARFNMLTQQPDFTVVLPVTNTYNPYTPGEIATQPGTENTIAINLGYNSTTVAYDFNPTAKTATARTNTAYNGVTTCLRFYDATHLLTPGSYGFGITSYPLTATGFGASTTSSLLNFNECFQLSGGFAFATTGGVADPSSTPARQVGTFTLPSGNYYAGQLVAPDTSLQRSFFLLNTSPAASYGGINGVNAYDANTFQLTSSVFLNFAANESTGFLALDFFRWGQDGLAALTSGGHIYLMRGGAVVPQLLNTNTASTLTAASAFTITHGAGNTLLTLTGSNFIPGVAVTWNGSYRTTTIVDATHVTVAIPAADLAAAGTGSLVATNPGAPASNALTVTVN